MRRLGNLIRLARGEEPRNKFAERLGLSYTFVRALERGDRIPSDRVLLEIVDKLELDPDESLLAAWCDRSPRLDEVLRKRGIRLPKEWEGQAGSGESHAQPNGRH